MSFKRIKLKRSIIFTWILSYTIVLLTPVLFIIFNYFQTQGVIVEEINRSNQNLLAQIRKETDNMLKEAQNVSIEIALNARIHDVLSISGPLDGEKYYRVYKAFEDIKTYKMSNSLLDFAVYFKNIDVVITPETIYDHRASFHRLYENSSLSAEQFANIMEGDYKGEYKLMPFGQKSGREYYNIAYLRSLRAFSGLKNDANVFFLFDYSKIFKEKFDLNSIGKAVVLLLDNKNDVISASSDINFSEHMKSAITDVSNGMAYSDMNGTKMVISYTDSSLAGWKYAIVAPESMYWNKAVYVRNVTFVGLLFCLLLGVALEFFFLRRNYKPVTNMVKSLKGLVSASKNDSNEYQLIEHAIFNTLEEKGKLEDAFRQQKMVSRAAFLEKLLKDKKRRIPLDEALEAFNIKFSSAYFAVIIFSLENGEELSQGKLVKSAEDLMLVKFAIGNVIEELISNENQGWAVEVDEMVICLVNLSENNVERGRGKLAAFAEEAREFIFKHFGINFFISVSDIHEGIAGISVAYSQALETMEYKMILGVEEVVFHDELPNTLSRGYDYSLDMELKMINCIKAGEFSRAEIILEEVFNLNFKKNALTLKVAKCLMFDLVSTMIKTINEIGDLSNNEFIEKLNPVERLLACPSVQDMKIQMMSIVRSFCEYISQQKSSKKSIVTERVTAYLEENYSDENLSIASIAEYIGLHPVYVSGLFKEETGESLPNYINRFRIMKAKEIIKDQKIKLDDVAKEVGYTNVRTFRRAFTKMEGVTPGKFMDG